MKKTLFVMLLLFLCNGTFAQTDADTTVITSEIQRAIDACIALSDASESGDSIALKAASDSLRMCELANFNRLKCQDDSISGSLDGHLVFDEDFADSLASGVDVKRDADTFRTIGASRGQSANGKILTKTCFVKAGQSTKYSFASRGHQELAVVAESGGLVTMRIHATNTAGFDKRYDDTKDVKKGQPHRKVSFELPKDKRNIVELEVINCCKKDISFVVISN